MSVSTNFCCLAFAGCASTHTPAWLEEAPSTEENSALDEPALLEEEPGVPNPPATATAGIVGRDGRRVFASGAFLTEAPDPLPGPTAEEQLMAEAQRNLKLLRAKFLQEQLSQYSAVVAEPGPHTFGDSVPLHLDIQNQTGQDLAFISPTEGVIIEIDWVVERWLPFGGHDSVRRHQWFRLFQDLSLGAGEAFQLDTSIPLSVKGEQGAAWLLSIDARLRCDGAVLGEEELSMMSFDFHGTTFLAFPAGWQELREEPLEALRRLVQLSDPRGDRHVMVATALLEGEDRQEGLTLLADGLATSPSVRRTATLVSALQWLTRLDIGSDPRDWKRWWAEVKMAR